MMKFKTTLWYITTTLCFYITVATAPALGAYGDHDGPYGENNGIHGGNRLAPSQYPPMDPAILGWATTVVDYNRSTDITHGTPDIVLGQPGGTSDVFSLGDGGWIIVGFAEPIADLAGPDLAVWENGFISRQAGDQNQLFAELMFVEVSTNGQDFVRFPSINLVPQPLGGFSCLDPTYVHNVVGKHPNGNDDRDEGTPFDLSELSEDPMVLDGTVDLAHINYVRLVDVIGDGTTTDSQGNAMYDPYPTPFGTGGADVDAVGALNFAAKPGPQPPLISPTDGAIDIDLTPLLESAPIAVPDGDVHTRSQWQICPSQDWNQPAACSADILSTAHLTSLRVPYYVLNDGRTYHWRVRYHYGQARPSEWSMASSFTTRMLSAQEKDDENEDGVPDSQQNATITDLDDMDGDDAAQANIKTLRTLVGDIHAGLKIPTDVLATDRFRSADPSNSTVAVEPPQTIAFGSLEFKLKVDVGATVTVDLFLSDVFSSDAPWFYFSPQSGWMNFSDHTTITEASDGITRITIDLTDGGAGDADGIANGWIIHSGGLAASSDGDDTPTPAGEEDNPDTNTGSGGGGGGCFIGQTVNPRH
jgi:hypothetical protein